MDTQAKRGGQSLQKRWTPAEDQLLAEFRDLRFPIDVIAHHLGRSHASVANHVNLLVRTGKLPKLHTPERSAQQNVLRQYQIDAAAHGRDWDLTEDQFIALISTPCRYCGLPPSNKLNHRNASYRDFRYSGIDRLDSNRGYEPDNVVSCCSTCNYAKRFMSEGEFLQWIARVYQHSC